jgi:L-ascorbate metabolism protein UlaG (beta-lactamase superfamily)
MGAACAITWWGHATVDVSLDGVRLLTDPLLRRRVGPLHSLGHRPTEEEVVSVDVVLLSHLHRDHTDVPSLARLPKRTRIVVPFGGGPYLTERVPAYVTELDVGETVTIGAVTVTGVAAVHDGRRHAGGPRAVALGYVVAGSRQIYFAGDTDIFAGMADVPGLAGGGLDAALLPIAGWGLTLGPGHMDAEVAARAVALLRPELAIPIHWGTLRVPVVWRMGGKPATSPETFAAEVAATAPRTEVVIPTPGKPIPLCSDARRHG